MALDPRARIILAAIFAFAFHRIGMLYALSSGVVFGAVVYGVNFYGFIEVFPWFAKARNLVTFASRVLFGVVLALSYKSLQRN